jgi:hypothetical protein
MYHSLCVSYFKKGATEITFLMQSDSGVGFGPAFFYSRENNTFPPLLQVFKVAPTSSSSNVGATGIPSGICHL